MPYCLNYFQGTRRGARVARKFRSFSSIQKGPQMSQRHIVSLVDDLDESEADETVTFGLDGATYEIDLNAEHAGELRDALAIYIAHSRRAGNVRGRVATRRAASSGGGNRLKTADVRTWARENGYEVSDRGRIPAAVIEAYNSAN